jgi:prolyl oligopeptidase
LLVATDFGPGSLSAAGYPRIFKRWKRGTPLAEATTVFEAEAEDVGAWVSVDHTPGHAAHAVLALDRLLPPGVHARERGATRADRRAVGCADLVLEPRRRTDDTLLIALRSDLVVGERRYRAGALLAADAAAT